MMVNEVFEKDVWLMFGDRVENVEVRRCKSIESVLGVWAYGKNE